MVTNKSCVSITYDKFLEWGSDNNLKWYLKIHNAKKEDEGFYKCQLNSNPQIFRIGYLDVIGMYIHRF